jgi:ParB-like chromosome segregation protein Spo0J
MGANKLEVFEIVKVNRQDIHGADYNPRKISEAARKKLRAGLKKYGLVQPIVVNRKTMNIVGGHQRIREMDDIIRKPDYELHVAMIDVSEKDEVSINVQLNNESLQGEWDTFALQDLKNVFPDIDFVADFGFDESEIDVMLGDAFKDVKIEAPLIDPMKEAKKSAEDFRQMKKDQREKAKNRDAENPQEAHELSDLDYTLTVVFPNNREKADFMRKIRKDPKEKYIKSSIFYDIQKGVYDISALNK